MEVRCEKLIGLDVAQRACEVTMNRYLSKKEKKSNISLKRLYHSEHSPMYTQVFWIDLIGIPTYVHTHLRTHSTFTTHFVESNRRSKRDDGRGMPVNHSMMINAKSLVDMARKRLCTQSDPVTVKVMRLIKEAVRKVDPDLADCMVPECQYSKCRDLFNVECELKKKTPQRN